MDSLLQLDEQLFLALNGDSSPGLDLFFSLVTTLGQASGLIPLVLGPMALADRERLREHGLAMILSVTIGALAVEGLKTIFSRLRPVLHFAKQGRVVRMPRTRLFGRSFPSGHAQASAGAATYLSLLYPRFSALAALAATLCALSRIYLGVHFPSDVIAGALCGVLFSIAGFRLRAQLAARRSTESRGAGIFNSLREGPMTISKQIEATADILLAAAHADGRYLPEERALVEQILRSELGDAELPAELASRIEAFEPDTFELVEACERLGATTPARRRRILAMVARVVEVDEIHDLEESHFIRRLARCLEAEPEEYQHLTVEIELVVAALPPPIPPPRPRR